MRLIWNMLIFSCMIVIALPIITAMYLIAFVSRKIGTPYIIRECGNRFAHCVSIIAMISLYMFLFLCDILWNSLRKTVLISQKLLKHLFKPI